MVVVCHLVRLLECTHCVCIIQYFMPDYGSSRYILEETGDAAVNRWIGQTSTVVLSSVFFSCLHVLDIIGFRCAAVHYNLGINKDHDLCCPPPTTRLQQVYQRIVRSLLIHCYFVHLAKAHVAVSRILYTRFICYACLFHFGRNLSSWKTELCMFVMHSNPCALWLAEKKTHAVIGREKDARCDWSRKRRVLWLVEKKDALWLAEKRRVVISREKDARCDWPRKRRALWLVEKKTRAVIGRTQDGRCDWSKTSCALWLVEIKTHAVIGREKYV